MNTSGQRSAVNVQPGLGSQFSVFSSQYGLWFRSLLSCLILFFASRAAAQIPGLQANAARDCATCHLSWVEAFRRPQAVLLMPPPTEPVVAESDTCLGCHDGAVDDSRRRVWLEHGHLTGVEPPPGMTVPANLPLKNGQLACRTCHTAHSGEGPETLATAVFVRMRNDASQLCLACHTADAYTGGVSHGAHPLGAMPVQLPPALAEAGAHAGPDGKTLTCQTCHEPHGSQEDHLLVMSTQTSALCVTCHVEIEPALWRPDVPRDHPQNPPLTSQVQIQAIKDMGTRIGPDNTLICLSCHQMHKAPQPSYLLADTLADSQLCLRCHPDNRTMFGTDHDLRTSAPESRNAMGQTPQESGPCGACHTFHHFARTRSPMPLDPSGLCATCHQEGEPAAEATGLPFSHPPTVRADSIGEQIKLALYPVEGDPARRAFTCLTCHEPHDTKHRSFLRAEPTTICATCHGDKVASLADAHDFTDRPELKNARGLTAAQAGQCGFCHGVHNAEAAAMWVATAKPPEMPNGWCLSCHSENGTAAHAGQGTATHPEQGTAAQSGQGTAAARNSPPLRHPAGPTTTMPAPPPPLTKGRPGGIEASPPLAKGGPGRVEASPPLTKGGLGGVLPAASPTHTPTGPLPLYDHQGRRSPTGFIACSSCHDPHGSAADAMLRLAADQPDEALCAACHTQAHSLPAGLHSDRFLASHFEDVRFCAPCHVAHEKPGMPPTGMWAAPVGSQDQHPAMRQCAGCHGPAGTATAIEPTIHPAVPMHNVAPPGEPGWMPLFNAKGEESPGGQIACGTCHLPHGPTQATGLPEMDIDEMPAARLRGLRPMVRPYIAPNVCSACHGFDGLRRYLYYHQPDKRRPRATSASNGNR